jgi:phospholipid/cholesterol/gamma-HCH transport system permease protein
MPNDFVDFDPQTHTLLCKGEWTLKNIAKIRSLLKKQIPQIQLPSKNEIIIDGQSLKKLDSAGAFLLLNEIKPQQDKASQGNKIQFQNFSEQNQKLLSMMGKSSLQKTPQPHADTNELNWIQTLGKYGLAQAKEFHEFLSFIGQLFFTSLHSLTHPKLWRINSITHVINTSGAQALPIIALLSFTIGVVISYQMGMQLREYGADVFIVNLLGLSILREFAPLLTAIMVGGRTGSSFTAQLGIMKINQEIDALTTMGIAPAELLLLPRITGMLIVLPLLTIWADMFGILGGMVMAQYLLGVTWQDFIIRFEQEIPLRTLFIGLGKAPVYALIIASIGCFEGMKVSGSAESVGKKTTRSVVLAIFFIIIFDGLCSVLLSKYKL